jgi:23S rRNA G2069 N7-methylase RlmK/C1962 C5-methylase RlmI
MLMGNIKYPDEVNILKSVAEYSKNRKVLDLSNTNGAYAEAAMDGGAKEVYILSKDNDLSSDVYKVLDFGLMEFIDLSEETGERYDMIILHTDIFNLQPGYDIQAEHKELIRKIQSSLLNYAGILFFIIRKEGFVLDQYLKPGADKLTKKLMMDEFKGANSFQCYAFYN